MSLRVFARLLLCLILVLNGSGYAVAATQMHMAHMTMALGDDQKTSPPCHEMDHHAAMAMDAAAAEDECQAPTGHAKGPDCCQSSQCSCDCLQHATATVPVPIVVTGTPSAAHVAPAMNTDHVSPWLPNLFRPPIA